MAIEGIGVTDSVDVSVIHSTDNTLLVIFLLIGTLVFAYFIIKKIWKFVES